MSILLTWLFASIGFLLAGAVVPDFRIKGFGNAAITAVIFGALNLLLGWLLFLIIGVGTLGIGFLLAFITRWVVNGILLKLTAGLTDKLTIRGFMPALLGSLVISLVTSFGMYLVGR